MKPQGVAGRSIVGLGIRSERARPGRLLKARRAPITAVMIPSALKAKVAAAVILAVTAFGCAGQDEPARPPTPLPTAASDAPPDVSAAATYKVLGKRLWTHTGAERGTFFISSPAPAVFEARAQTAMKAALELSAAYGLEETEVMLVSDEKLLERGQHYARAVYRKGKAMRDVDDTWAVTSSDEVLTEKELAIARLWYENADRFETKEGYTDHDRLNKFIAVRMKMRVEDVDLPAPNTRPYVPMYGGR